ncbi:hypothetical protein [Mycobacterium sp. MMS18-G62]
MAADAIDVPGLHAAMRASLRAATPFDLPADLVMSCSDSAANDEVQKLEEVFRLAVTTSLASIPTVDRTNRLNGVTGHIAESVVACLWEDLGFTPIQHMVGPESGGHGVDLLMLTPGFEAVFSIEVKGTLQRGRWPRLTRGEVAQMTAEWLDKTDNPGMADHDLVSGDVYGAVALVNFARMQWKAAVTADFSSAHPITDTAQLEDVAWLVDAANGVARFD